MIRNAERHELEALRTVLNDANDAPYDLGVVAEEKCFGRGLAGEPVVRVFEDAGRIRGVAVRCGKYLRLLAVARDHRRRGIGTALLRDADAEVIAAEAGNYFTPGVFEKDASTMEFLRSRGYREGRAVWNLDVILSEAKDLGDGDPSLSSQLRMTGNALEFIEREFGTAWRFESERGYVIYMEGVGFAAYEANNRGLGTFGPMGVIASARGHGYGRELLTAALRGLRGCGYGQVIIPWTEATTYYARVCGARPAHRFVTFVK